MAVTNRLASTRLQSGEDTAEVTLTPAGEGLVLRLTTTAVVSPCQVRMTVRDSQGRNMGSLVCQDGDDKRLNIEGFESGGLVFQVECNLGTADVQVDELTDLDAVLPEGSGAGAPTLELDDLPDDTITAAKFAVGMHPQNPAVLTDPTGTGTITPVAAFSTVAMANSAGTRVLADPAFEGQQVVITGGGGNNPALSPETGDWNGTAGTATFGAAADRLIVIGAGAEWRILANVDVALA